MHSGPRPVPPVLPFRLTPENLFPTAQAHQKIPKTAGKDEKDEKTQVPQQPAEEEDKDGPNVSMLVRT